QTSDITYRIYDWGRVDEKGNSRELHTELALDAIDFEPHNEYKTQVIAGKDKPTTLANSQYFTVRLIDLDNPYTYQSEGIDSFVVYLCVGGEVHISHDGGTNRLSAGECLLVPAIIRHFTIAPKPKAQLLEVFCS
ncbi:MAG TPA: hypothetical protein VLH16_05515, partial [Bacteroidales bacterium]|nr:hypothetical protein [Bacteroidales bacterium]